MAWAIPQLRGSERSRDMFRCPFLHSKTSGKHQVRKSKLDDRKEAFLFHIFKIYTKLEKLSEELVLPKRNHKQRNLVLNGM
jgi:hypothetical protein